MFEKICNKIPPPSEEDITKAQEILKGALSSQVTNQNNQRLTGRDLTDFNQLVKDILANLNPENISYLEISTFYQTKVLNIQLPTGKGFQLTQRDFTGEKNKYAYTIIW